MFHLATANRCSSIYHPTSDDTLVRCAAYLPVAAAGDEFGQACLVLRGM